MTATSTVAPIRPHQASLDTGSYVRPVQRFQWEPVPVPAPATDVAFAVAGRQLLVLGEDAALVRGVAAALEARGATVDVALPGVEPVAEPWDGIVDLNVVGRGYRPDQALTDTPWQEALRRTVRMINTRYPDWEHQISTGRCAYVVVTALGGLMGYDGAPGAQPLGGIWSGLAKGLLRELPNASIKVVDLDPRDGLDPLAVGHAVAVEIAARDSLEIGYRDGGRYALRSRPAEVEPPTTPPGPADDVLISGGARGVGFALARGLAELGCRVVVTGRAAVPAGEPWLDADDAAYGEYHRAQIASARTPADIRRIRATLRRQDDLRVVARNLAAAARDGLPITYEPCDVVDPQQVAALFARIPPPSIIVHNAGIDEPKRLVAKSPDEVVRVVEVKVSGFANLLGAVLAAPERRAALRMWSNVGSLAGRLGGMIGQVDYAAGNDALTRLGFWAGAEHGVPVRTMCWPTWERLGVIANYDAAIRYVSTIAPEEGVDRWIAELSTGRTGEVGFIGRVGRAMVPSTLRAFWLFTGHPDLPRLHALAHFLGDVEVFEQFRQVRGRVVYPPASPCLAEVQLDGVPMLPVSMVVEQACTVADWVVPPGWPLQHLVEIREVEIDVEALRMPDGEPAAFTTHATGEIMADDWIVEVSVSRDDGTQACSLQLVYRPKPPDLGSTAPATFADGLPPRAARATGMTWTGLVLPRAAWSTDADGQPWAPVGVVTGADLWTVAFPPVTGIAPAAIEAVLQASPPAATDRVRIRALRPRPGAQRLDTIHGSADRENWVGVRDGAVVLEIEGVTTAPARPATRAGDGSPQAR